MNLIRNRIALVSRSSSLNHLCINSSGSTRPALAKRYNGLFQAPALHLRKMSSRAENTRVTVATAGRVEGGQKIGDPNLPIVQRGDDFCRVEFHSPENEHAVDFVARRIRKYDEIKAKRDAELANVADYPREEIVVELSGKGLSGVKVKATSWQTRPIELGKIVEDKAVVDALKEAFKTAVVAKVYMNEKPRGKQVKMADSSGLDDEAEKDHSGDPRSAEVAKGQLWDLLRPLEGSCRVELLDFDDPEGRAVFWHSSAHVLGECLECGYGCQLTVGPPTKQGFFYDCYMGSKTVDDDFKRDIEKKAKQVCQVESPPEKGQKQSQIGQKFERLVVSKAEALTLFESNPFKVAMIQSKIPDGGFTTVYRCGPMVDLCMGPHIPNTRAIKGFAVLHASQANFAGKAENDSLQRVYGVSFPDEKRLNAHLQNLKEAKENDHRVRGKEQELFFFHPLSPGSAFFEPAGARIYNRLMDFIRAEYRKRGYQEVVTPNIYNVDLWKTSGHWEHYAKNMFSFTDGEEHDHGHEHGHDHGHDHHEHQEEVVDESTLDEAGKKRLAAKKREQERRKDASTFALKPMNCPGHCLMFANRDRSYRELPLRIADFGVLHRNELSGALTGLTRVRRFQQDDAHIFCQRDQIKQEVLGALNFMKHVYGTFGMTYKLERSTRPAKAAGLETPEGVALWDDAETQLANAMDEFSGPGTWRDNPGDGAFYGPKIDIKVFDAQGRMHQCATVQLDFQLPIRFGLEYFSQQQTRERPVMVHRAMLGSVERFIAILTEHFRGRWPFWLSPRQAMVVPMLAGSEEENKAANAYSQEVAAALKEFYVEIPNNANDHHNEAIKKAFDVGTKFCLCIGPSEVRNGTVSVEGRQPYGSTAKGPVHFGICSVDALLVWFRAMQRDHVLDENILNMPETPKFQKQSYQKGQNKQKHGDGEEVPKSPTKAASSKNVEEPAPKRKQEAVKAAQAPSKQSGDSFFVGDDSFPTVIPGLKGKRFATMEEFTAWMQNMGSGPK